MSALPYILQGFYDALNTNELAWAELRIGPVQLNSRENICYIESGPTIEYEERGGNRIQSAEIILSIQRTATNRTDLSGIEVASDALDLILDSVDTNRTLQTRCESILPLRTDIFYDDKEGMQSVKMQITYSVRFARTRRRAR